MRNTGLPSELHSRRGSHAKEPAMKRMSLAFFVLVACANPNAGFHPPVAPTTTQADANAKAGDADVVAKREGTPMSPHPDQMGMATWYGGAFAGRKTANGEIFDP